MNELKCPICGTCIVHANDSPCIDRETGEVCMEMICDHDEEHQFLAVFKFIRVESE